jgi:hypothetical protein
MRQSLPLPLRPRKDVLGPAYLWHSFYIVQIHVLVKYNENTHENRCRLSSYHKIDQGKVLHHPKKHYATMR